MRRYDDGESRVEYNRQNRKEKMDQCKKESPEAGLEMIAIYSF